MKAEAPAAETPPAQEPSTAPTVEEPPAAPVEQAPPRPAAPSTGVFANDTQPTASFPSEATPPPTKRAPRTSAGRDAESKPAPHKPAPARVEQRAPTPGESSPTAAARRTQAASNPEQNRSAASRDDVTKEKDDDDGGGFFGPIRLGPMVGVGLPNLLSFGGLLKLTRYLGGGINIGLIPTVRVSYYGEAKLLYQEYDVFGRIFPFGGGLFLGAGVGYETVKGTLANKMDTSPFASQLPQGLAIPNPLDYESAGSVRTMVLTPQLGYFYTTGIGFSLGLDVGLQLPIAPSEISFKGKLTLPANTPAAIANQVQAGLVDPNDNNVRESLQKIGRTPLPTFNIKIGWLL